MTLPAIYLSVILFGALLVVRRSGPTLLRGEGVFALTAAFVGGAVVSMIRSGAGPGWAVTAFWAAAAICSLLVRKKWFLFGGHREGTAGAVEDTLRALLLRFERAPEGYTLALAGGTASIQLWWIFPWVVVLSFRGNRSHKKARLLFTLLAKKFQPVFPRPTIDLR